MGLSGRGKSGLFSVLACYTCEIMKLRVPYVGSRLTNAIAEGINRIIKIVKNRASGFRHLHAFSDMIFLTVGDVDREHYQFVKKYG